jgi:hypothetical protein
MQQWFKTKAKSYGGAWTTRSMCAAMREEWGGLGSPATVHRLARLLGYRLVHKRAYPLLSAAHRKARMEWCERLKKHEFEGPDVVWLHLDEKWFYSERLNRFYWVAKGDPVPAVMLQSKTNIVKVMGLAAVAQPRPNHNFSGNVGFYPCGAIVPAPRNSKNRPKGTPIFKSRSVDVAYFLELITEHVIPDVLKLCGSWAQRIVIQMDNAGGHGGGRGDMQQTTLLQLQRFAAALPDELRALCTHPEGLPQFEFITQPAKSPDLNVLDQGAWTSLQVAVDAVKDQASRGLMQLNETELYQAMLTGWDEWCKISSTKLTSLFSLLQLNAQKILECQGGNMYLTPHSKNNDFFF